MHKNIVRLGGVCLSWWVLLSGVLIQAAEEQRDRYVGQNLIVVTNEADLKLADKTVARLPFAEGVRTDRTLGDWLWIERMSGDSGWLDRKHVLSVSEALQRAGDMIKQSPQDSTAYTLRGTAWRLKGETDIALSDFNDAVRHDPTFAAGYRGRALTWETKQQYAQAVRDHSEALRLAPTADTYYSRGWNELQIKEYAKSVRDFNEALDMKPRFAPALSNRGRAYRALRQYDQALADFGAYLKLKPNDASVYFNRAWVAIDQQRYDAALDDFSTAIRLNPKFVEAYWDRSYVWNRKGDYGRAIADLSEAIRLNPQAAGAWYSRGSQWFASGDFEKALDDFNAALQRDPNHFLAGELRRRTWGYRGDYAKVEQELLKLTRDAKATPAIQSRLAWFRATCPQEKYRKPAEALEIARGINEQSDYSNAGYLDVLAAAFAATGDFSEAVARQKQAVAVVGAEDRAAFEERLRLYTQNKPFRDERAGLQLAWKPYSNREGAFRVEFPGTPQQEINNPEQEHHQHLFQVKLSNQVQFVVSYLDIPADKFAAGGTTAAWTQRFRDSFTKGKQVLEEKTITIDKLPAIELRVADPKDNTIMEMRLVGTGRRAYQVVAGGPRGEATSAGPALRRFLESFHMETATAPGSAAPASPPDALPAPGENKSVADEAGWVEVVASRGRYRTRFPTRVAEEDKTSGDRSVRHYVAQYKSEERGLVLQVDAMDYSGTPNAAEKITSEQILSKFLEGFAGTAADSARPGPEVPGWASRTIQFTRDGVFVDARLYAQGLRLYVTWAGTAEANQTRNAADIQRFHRAFRIGDTPVAATGNAQEGWPEYTSDSARLSVRFPGKPTVAPSSAMTPDDRWQAVVESPQGLNCAVMCYDISAEYRGQFATTAELLKSDVTRVQSETNAKVLRDAAISRQTYPGVETILQHPTKDKTLMSRSFLAGNRMYTLIASAPTSQYAAQSGDMQRFLDSFVILSTASPDGKLTLSQVSATYGMYGPPRASEIYYPYDNLSFQCLVHGASLRPNGKNDLQFRLGFHNPTGETNYFFEGALNEVPDQPGQPQPLNATIMLPGTMDAGDFIVVAVVRDRVANREATFHRHIRIRPAEFSIVGIQTYRDAAGKEAAPLTVPVGETRLLMLRTVGLDRASGKLDARMTVMLLDAQRKPMLEKPLETRIATEDPSEVAQGEVVTFTANFKLRNPGPFTISITVEDSISGRKSHLTLPGRATPSAAVP